MRTKIFLLKASCILLSAFLICGNTSPLAFCQQGAASISITPPDFITGMEMALHHKKEVIINIVQPIKPIPQPKSIESRIDAAETTAIFQATSPGKKLMVSGNFPVSTAEPASDSVTSQALQNVDTSADPTAAIENPASGVPVNKLVVPKGTTIITINETHPNFNDPVSVIEEMSDPVIGKYADMISLDPSDISNYPLYKFIDRWYGTRYKWGGTSLKGIDCSAFSQKLYDQVYKTELTRTSRQQLRHCDRFKNVDEAAEGDLIFFRINRIRVSHVGIYLANGYFVHASRSHGVMISNVEDKYWSRRYAGCGRVEHDENMPAESDLIP